MKNLLLAACLAFLTNLANAQGDDVKTARDNARNYIQKGDYSNAVLVLNRALQKETDNFELQKDLAFAYYLDRKYAQALEVAKPFVDRNDVDVQGYQILGMIYKAIEERKDCEKMYKIAIKKFPNSGVLYNEYGEMYWTKKEALDAIKLWEKGIQADPNYSGNYYNAAKYYFYSYDKVWAIVYGEIFVNLESYTKRTAEIKEFLLEAYKKLFTDGDLAKNQDSKNDFVRTFLDEMKSQSGFIATNGVNPETLSAIRTKFVIDWFAKQHATHLPFRLYEYHQQLLKSGMFEAYNQWLFGTTASLTAYETWTKSHTEEYNKFNYFQHNRVFKLPSGQYYQTANQL